LTSLDTVPVYAVIFHRLFSRLGRKPTNFEMVWAIDRWHAAKLIAAS
jgi:hypothetical protein